MKALALISAIALTACSSLEHRADDWMPTTAQGQHVTAGAAMGAITYGATDDPHWACASSVAIGAAKELYDATGRGHATLSDVAWTAVPSCLIWYSIDWWRSRR